MSIYAPVVKEGESRRVLALRSPIDLAPIGELVCANRDDVHAAVARAHAAQSTWAAKSFDERAAYMQRALHVLLARQDEIIDTVVRETGKARLDAMSMEIFAAADSLCYYAKNAGKFLKPQRKRVHGLLGIAKQLRIVYRPLGVIGVITPWNAPFVLAMNPSVQALMAGNAVVLKGSEVTPYSTRLVEDIFREAGLPDGLLQVLMGDGETGAHLVDSAIDKIAFTGSVRTGRLIAEACGRRLVPCTLELGGKDAMIVCEDADLDRAAAGAIVGSCMNTGHYCCGTERIYVVEPVYDAFLAKVVEGTRKLRQGSSLGFEEDVGAVFWDRQMAIIEEHVADARAKGATVHVGGRRNPDLPGLYYEPTVISGVDSGMQIMREETFGPILCVQKVRDVEEALRLANDSPYGLNGNVWTRDKQKGFAIATRMDTGSVSVNDMAMSYGVPAAPFGGRKESGIGQVNGEVGLRGYCHAMPVVIDRFGGKELPSAYPYTLKKAEGMRKLMSFLWTTPLGRWLS
ncbi:MAG: aldehyde dehydrogenase family protein [Pseudomonadales bacterium]|nr:aldehyde dehydrogenase family protein [Pseudomonadales bacterium]MCP5321453.1 aldehyde dehydrogenase family protein [Pseudomonadales bacterium]MCP5336363.1 aldehyde dehydrogenase family protein [Pseudomonadales bacterium]